MTFVNGTYTITPKTVTLTLDNQRQVYGSPERELTYTVEGLVGEDELKDITTTRQAGNDVGIYVISASGEATSNPNYSVNYVGGIYAITPKDITE